MFVTRVVVVTLNVPHAVFNDNSCVHCNSWELTLEVQKLEINGWIIVYVSHAN